MNLTPDQIEGLRELVNIGVGKAAAMLNEMVQTRIYLQVPYIKVLFARDAKKELSRFGNDQLAATKISFNGAFSGTAILVFPSESASNLVAVITEEEPGTPDLDSIKAVTLNEVGNVVINGVMGSIGNMLKERVRYSFPIYMDDTIKGLLNPSESDPYSTVLLANTRFTIKEHKVEGDIILLFEVGSFDVLISAIDDMSMEEDDENERDRYS